jgi:hypothetical protein
MDLFGTDKPAKVKKDGTEKTGRQKVAPKYRDPATGAMWGSAPKPAEFVLSVSAGIPRVEDSQGFHARILGSSRFS